LISTGPRVVIGVPLYNSAEHLEEALESLLGQTYRDFALVLVDDCSSDGTAEIAHGFASREPRVSYERNGERHGLVRNWRKTFERALERHPGAEYFAWASDHDLWDGRWLEALVAELESDPGLVLAYPLMARISATGDPLPTTDWRFETVGVSSTARRLRLAVHRMSAGNMVYGLFRAAALKRAGALRDVLLPDRLLVSELCLYGQFRQLDEVLWRRRFTARPSLKRQRSTFFPRGAPPYTYLPWWLVHAGAFAWVLGVRGQGEPLVSRRAGLLIAVGYVPLGLLHQLRRRFWRTVYRMARPVGRARQRVGAARRR
jgi:glycosyltransferase involved in cell wall biosynthesis